MKEEIIQVLGNTIAMLNNVTVSGKQNFNNMALSINAIEQVIGALRDAAIDSPVADEPHNNSEATKKKSK